MNGPRWEQFPSGSGGGFLICPKCKVKSCRYLQSKTADNPGRYFFKCPSSDQHFFKWADQVSPHELIQVPDCGGCGAGVCRVKIETAGPDKGRVMFMCRVKEGEGSCGYRVWQHELQMLEAGEMLNPFPSRLIKCSKTSTTVIDVDEESNQRDEGTDPVSPLMEPSDDVLCREVISRKTDQHKCVEGKSRTTSRRHPKRSRCGDIIGTVAVSDIPVSASFSTVWPDLNFMSATDCWMVDAFCQNLSSELNGWWGRLVFQSTRCLMPHELKPSTSSLSYPLESTFVKQDKLVERHGSIASSRNSEGVERYIEVSFIVEQHHSPVDSGYVVEGNILVNSSDASTSTRSLLGDDTRSKPVTMSRSISNIFHEAAECLQDELLTHLEKMDAKDHEAMHKEAEVTFAALDRLAFDYKDFKKGIDELIHCASQLVEINRSLPTDDSLQKLVQICSSERERLDKINCVHAEVIEAELNNKKRINILREEISSAKDWLFQIEAEVSCCEVEMRSLELELEKISKSKEALEGKYLIASKEVEESRKLLEQKEAEQNAAEAKFNRARALLRG